MVDVHIGASKLVVFYKIRLLFSSLILFFCFTIVKAQQDPIHITTDTISTSTFCAGDTVSVPFTSDAPFDTNNMFYAQISDALGSFSNPISIGRLSSRASSGIIRVVIPINIPPGTGYRIRVVGTNPESTGSDNGANLAVNNNSAIDLVTSDINNICPFRNVELTAKGVTLGTRAALTWYDGPPDTNGTVVLGNSNPLMVSPSGTTTYYVRSDGGCSVVEKSITVIVDETESSISSVTSDIDSIYPGTSVELTANGLIIGTGATLIWYDGPSGAGTILGSSNPLTVSPPTTTTYYARLEGSCNTVEESITVMVDQLEEGLYNFPTAFTPNGDHVNDVWDIGENRIHPRAQVWIYDNNGQLVFKSLGYEKPWDGNYKGRPQPVGTYYYVIKLNDKKQKEGFVMILK